MIRINERAIGEDSPPFIIAEMSSNHNQSLDRALKIVEVAAETGVHALKLQTATSEGLTLDVDTPEFLISDPNSLWFGQNLFQLYQKSVTPWEWHQIIFDRCEQLGLICFSSPFELKAVDLLEEIGAPCYKIASFELVDLQLIRRVAMTGKPIIMSTGMATLSEIELAVCAAREVGNTQVILLKCTSTYPATPEDSNLNTLPHLRAAFGTEVGLSDHTMGIGVPCAAVALGATVIEKHFTLSRAEGGLDATFSLEPDEFKQLVIETERAWHARGEVKYGGTVREQSSLQFRRSIYISEDVSKDEVLTHSNVRVVRPGYGLPPSYIDVVLGRRVNCNLKKGTAMSWEYIG
ncbi:MAG: pseudaminic acid synthase [Verrucomicrobia bacterium RIFCSPHIGHO2_12_FULL_41_10]|nr:MAG: pseudaminic acid synthase [Verrucomicrobia bacterium RIFCSPHIGHO2_12_FULL_41_10]